MNPHPPASPAPDPEADADVVAYLEAVESGETVDRSEWERRYPALARFLADEEVVSRWTAPLREALSSEAAAAGTTVAYEPRPAAPPLTSFGDYEILEKIGHGGQGVVYKARYARLNRLVALKVILAGGHAGEQHLARFLAEAEAVARFQHPNIVQIHEIGEHEGRPYFSLEFVPGGSLAQRLKGSPLPDEKEAAHLVEVLARAVHHAHEHGIVHRDLKPANVLLMPDGTPKVADFGLARFLGTDDGQTADGAVLGTASYMAAEQAAGRGGEVGPLTDVYALGAILYECLTGRPPFRGATLMETLLLVQQEPPDRPRLYNPNVSRSLQAICLRCLAKDPNDRYPSAEALADDLGAYLRGEPVRADGGAASPLVQAMLRETRYTEVMTRWAGIWMGNAVVYFFICLAKSLLVLRDTRHQEFRHHGPYFIVWAACFLGMMGVAWFCRFQSGPPLSHVERQLFQIKGFFWVGFFLTAWVYQLGDGDIRYLLPILILEAAIAFGCMATILGGSFYVMAAACVATAVLEALWPAPGPLISAAVCSPALFWLGWKYWRRAPSA
jgi:serine/threonine-protein kinase